ncbi:MULTISPECIES: acyl-CoA dehydrogenase family protein [Streptomyces]|uniref:acyl-CoA dehydrogenase family protein n=1 Tax=Streptomyces TaxID=1883 RepID=UPI000241A5AE|nr:MULTISPECIES: acyl-CoA dehydrogenase family protein [Streptomyces]EHM24088.1 acyl-CoA dehydrogenase (NADP(+)) [Streptomyces sp. W007]MCX4486864.1 acyl-CoA dehydrogenase family protein [Streptomyces anulatus]MCX4502449.1 acyl-CoA dehydrogenase family protein [Streptomyces anulatus]MCX4523025.1 acyl-CoA dehydrogenase family protein [Streptomyces anulatus]MCX4606036.1 acyl-CoA dehydrogenase family protein [Streptomyces anulatus]
MDDRPPASVMARAEAFAADLAPRAAEFDRAERLPRDVVEQMADAGFLGARVPVEWGGLGLSPLEYGELTEVIGKACASTRALLTVHTSLVAETLADRASRRIREKYLPDLASGRRIACFALSEAEAGSDAAAMSTRYLQKGDTFVLDGHKKWISFAGIADVFLVFAADNGVVSAFLVDREMPGVEIRPMSGMLGNRATHMAEVVLSAVEVPAENLVCGIGSGFAFVANSALSRGRYSIAWAGVALAQAALEEMCTYAARREQFGSRIGSFQLVQKMIADAVTEVSAARELCRKAGRMRAERSPEAIAATNIAKYFSSTVACRVTSDAVQVLGGNGCWNGYPAERLFREAKILEIIEGTSQVQQTMIADFGLTTFARKG